MCRQGTVAVLGLLLLFFGSSGWAASDRTIYLEVVCTQHRGAETSQKTAALWTYGAPVRYRVDGLRPLQLSVSARVDAQGVLHVDNRVLVPDGSVYQARSSALFTLAKGSDPPIFRFQLDDTEVELKLVDARVSRADGAPPPEPPAAAAAACRVCGGAKSCQACGGVGKIICGNCFGTKVHTECSGNRCAKCYKGKCVSCGGTGYKMLCAMCGGSKKCNACGGSGSL